MAVALRGSAAIPSANPTTSFTVTIDAAVATDDALFLTVTSRDSTGAGTLAVTDNDSGGNTWTKIGNSTDHKATLWYKRATSATASKTVTVSNAVGSASGVLKAFSGALVSGNPYTNITVESNASADETATGITPDNADSMLCCSIHNYNNDNAVTNLSSANFGTFTQTEKLSTGGSDCACAFGHDLVTTGATGNVTWSQTDGTTYSIIWAIPPAPTAQTGTPGVASVAVSGVDATPSGTGTGTGTPGTATVAVSGVAPGASGTGTGSAAPEAATVSITGIAPAASATGSVSAVPGTASVTISGADTSATNQSAGSPSAVAGGAVPGVTSPNPVNWEHPLNRGLVAWWMALPDQQRGVTLRDLLGLSGRNGNDGTLTAGTTWAGARSRPGGFGSLEFDGTDDTVQLGSKAALSVSGELTIVAWVYPDTAANHWIIDNGFGSLKNYGLRQQHFSGSKSGIEWSWGSYTNFVDSVLSISAWNQVVLVRSGSTGSWSTATYVNGVSVHTASGITTNPDGSTRTTVLGVIGGGSPSQWWDGLMDDVRLYNRPLAAEEVYELFKQSRQGYQKLLRWADLLGGAAGAGTDSQTGTPGTTTVAVAGIDVSGFGSGTATATPGSATVTVSGVVVSAAGSGTASAVPAAATVTISAVDAAFTLGTVTATPGTATVTISGIDVAAAGSGVATATPGTATVTITAVDATATGNAGTATALVATVTVSAIDAGASGSGVATASAGTASVTVSAVTVSGLGSGAVTGTPGTASVTVSAHNATGTFGAVVVTPGAGLVTVSAIDVTATGVGVGTATAGVATVTVTAIDPSAANAIIDIASPVTIIVSPELKSFIVQPRPKSFLVPQPRRDRPV